MAAKTRAEQEFASGELIISKADRSQAKYCRITWADRAVQPQFRRGRSSDENPTAAWDSEPTDSGSTLLARAHPSAFGGLRWGVIDEIFFAERWTLPNRRLLPNKTLVCPTE
jgi:hypothetical protein